jgi:hypothetical protein
VVVVVVVDNMEGKEKDEDTKGMERKSTVEETRPWRRIKKKNWGGMCGKLQAMRTGRRVRNQTRKKSKSDTQGGPSQKRVSNPGQDSRVH